MPLKLQPDQQSGTKFNGAAVGVIDREMVPPASTTPPKVLPDQVQSPSSSESKAPPRQPTISQTLEYILSFTTELKFMAQQAGLSRLALILMLAEQEARQQNERQPHG